ncbi:MAG: choice-of-anchor D domain-containing protein [Archangium sp.]|nr:choice-of-anchor D domain-containing protein [Archangium sp.]
MKHTDQSWLAVVTAVLAGCSAQVSGVLALPPKVDFGTTSCGPRTLTFTVTNQSLAPLTITGASKRSGTQVNVNPFVVEPAPVFSLTLPQTLGPNTAVDVDVVFDAVTAGRHTAVLVVEAGRQQQVLELEGTYEPFDAGPAPERLDFGRVARGQRRTLTLPNPAPIEGLVQAGGEYSSDGGEVTFAPVTIGDVFATTTQPLSGGCPGQRLVTRLRGEGVEATVLASPSPLDLGFVPPGRTRTSAVRLVNHAFDAVPVVANVVEQAAVRRFSLATDAGFTVPGGRRDRATSGVLPGEHAVDVSFSPEAPGPMQATLQLSIDGRPMVVMLRGTGGGGVIAVSAPSLDFGAVTMSTTRPLRVSNAGTRPSPPDPRANLFLGLDGGMPYFELRHVSGATGTVSVTMTSRYDPSVGVAALSDVTFEVTALPGASVHDLHLFSTDFERPDLVVPIIVQ